MKIIEVARERRDILNEGIAYVAVWQEKTKNGKRSWDSEDIFPDGGVENDEPVFSDEQKARLTEIASVDPDAVLLNGWVHSWIGSMDEPLSAAQIAEGIKRHYEAHNFLISSYLADETETAEDSHTEPNTEETVYNPVSADVSDEEWAEREIRRMKLEAENIPDYSNRGAYGGDDIPDTVSIELPSINVNPDILSALIKSKATLIKTALGDDGFGELPIAYDESEGTVKFEWLRYGAESETIKAWSAFLAAAVRFSKTAKRVTAKDTTVGNEKFAFRTFLVKIGMNDASNKGYRKTLLRNLKGDAAFATPESKARWQAKRGNKKEEAVSDEQ